MHWLYFLGTGLVIGTIAKAIVAGRKFGGWIPLLSVSVLGAFVGGFLGRFVGMYGEEAVAGMLMTGFGSVILLVGYYAMVRRPRSGAAAPAPARSAPDPGGG